MPDHTDPKRRQSTTAGQRAQSMLDDVKATLGHRWSGRSWSDIAGSVWANRRAGVDAGIQWILPPWLTGPVAAVAGEDAAAYVETVMAVLDPAISTAKDAVTATRLGETVSKQAGAIYNSVTDYATMGLGGPTRSQEVDDLYETVEDVKKNFAEMALRVKNSAKAAGGTFQYCDDVYWAMHELGRAEFCRAEVMAKCDDAIAHLQAIKTLADQALPDAQAGTRRASFLASAGRVVADTATVQHKNHNNFGITGVLMGGRSAVHTISNSCSKEKCFGPGSRP